MKNKELNKLMSCIQNGDKDSFNLFYNLTHKGVFSFIYSYVKNYHTAEDLLQETYVKVKVNANKYALGTNALAWVLQIAKNTCLDYLRKEKAKPISELNEEISGKNYNILGDLYYHNLLNKYVADIDRQIVILHIIYGYKNREIAKILDVPLGTVLWKYNKILKELKKILEKED